MNEIPIAQYSWQTLGTAGVSLLLILLFLIVLRRFFQWILGTGEIIRLLKENNDQNHELWEIFHKAKINNKNPE